jgi:hypothetical protein
MHHVVEVFADNDDTLTLYFATFKYRRVYAFFFFEKQACVCWWYVKQLIWLSVWKHVRTYYHSLLVDRIDFSEEEKNTLALNACTQPEAAHQSLHHSLFPVPHSHLDAQPPGDLRLSPFSSSYLDAQPPTPRRRNRETSRIWSTSVLAGQGHCLDSPPPRSATSLPISLLAMLSAEPSSSTGDLVALAAGRREPPRMATGCTLKGWSCRGC